jgi:hypothetical protein
VDLDAYRVAAERFSAELSLAYYRHYAGLTGQLAIEPVYARAAHLFERDAVLALRERAEAGATRDDDGRRMRALLRFAVEGRLGCRTQNLDAELARREALTEIEVDGARLGLREALSMQANEADADRRARIERARLDAIASELNPLAAEALAQRHEVARDLGWPSYSAMFEQLNALDLAALERRTEALLAATAERYAELLAPELRRTTGVSPAELRRSDLPRLHRDTEADSQFPPERLVPALSETLSRLGIDLAAQANVALDIEPRPRKSPRAFCAAARVPGEVYLVVTPIGGRDDFAALFHEAGHAQHYAWTDPALAFELRHLGDSTVTEAFAFLFERLTDDPGWLRDTLGIDEPGPIVAHARTTRLLIMRRYAAKLAYERRLHSEDSPGSQQAAAIYAGRLGDAVLAPWPPETFLTDVDPGFYCASYLRAWALETRLRATLRERFGERWFAEAAAGAFLRDLWRSGRRFGAEELDQHLGGDGALGYDALLGELDLEATMG